MQLLDFSDPVVSRRMLVPVPLSQKMVSAPAIATLAGIDAAITAHSLRRQGREPPPRVVPSREEFPTPAGSGSPEEDDQDDGNGRSQARIPRY